MKKTNKIILKVQRYSPDTDLTPYFDEFNIKNADGKTVLDALLEIKNTIDGDLSFRYACGHGSCGSCAMNVNGINTLACETQLLGKESNNNSQIVVKPLSNSEIIKDLVIDDSKFWDNYKSIDPWQIHLHHDPEKEYIVFPEEVQSYRNAERCILCGVCTHDCPIQGNGFIGPHSLLKNLLLSKDSRDMGNRTEKISSIWNCTTCGICYDRCPKKLDPRNAIIELREQLIDGRKFPVSIEKALLNVFNHNNPFGMPQYERGNWLTEDEMKKHKNSTDNLYLTCCTICYDPPTQSLSQDYVKVMNCLREEVFLLGKNEICCGSEIRRIGASSIFEVLHEQNKEIISKVNPKKIITSSPHCFDVYKNYYNDLNVPVFHYTQQIASMIQEGRLVLNKYYKKIITFHDPCFLGIQNGIFDEPRFIITSIPGVQFREMEHHHNKSLCCGGGGGNYWIGKEENEKMAQRRVLEALSINAEIIATACPFCYEILGNAVKTLHLSKLIEVKDIMQIISGVI
jgi:succinate dehydrogenase/fumarate reductase iron-sulfur protein